MAFIRKRGASHQLIECYRKGVKVKHRTLANLGSHPNLAGAISEWPGYIEGLQKNLAKWQAACAEAKRQSAKLHHRIPWDRLIFRHKGPGFHRWTQLHGSVVKEQIAHWRSRIKREKRNLASLEAAANRFPLAVFKTGHVNASSSHRHPALKHLGDNIARSSAQSPSGQHDERQSMPSPPLKAPSATSKTRLRVR
jgi:hypothetical protein